MVHEFEPKLINTFCVQCFECNHPVLFYYLNNHKIPVKIQHIISIVLYSDMFRLARVIIKPFLTIFKVYKVTVHILDPKGLTSVGYNNILQRMALYGCEAWSLTAREERKLRVFENMVLRRIFGSRRDEVTGEWRIPHNEELNGLYSSPNIVRVIKSRRMRWAGHVARMGRGGGVYSLGGETGGKDTAGET